MYSTSLFHLLLESSYSARFVALHKYSPLHDVKSGIQYAAMLVTTADHDDSVVSSHSFKFAAMVQERHLRTNPVLIRIDTKSGHGAGNTRKQMETTADVDSFLLHNFGVVFREVR